MARDNLCYRDTRCSEQLYEHKWHLNLFHQKDIGILQFAKIGEKRGDEEKRLQKLKEYANPKDQDSYLLANTQNMGGKANDKGKDKKGDDDSETKAVKKSKS